MVSPRILQKTSPLYKFWISTQEAAHEKDRLSMVNNLSCYKEGIYLLVNEPYKWEILYQSTIREVAKGNRYSLYALKKLLITISLEFRIEWFKQIRNYNFITNSILDELEIELLNHSDPKIKHNPSYKNNLYQFLKILFAIFTNPYGVSVKKSKKRIYEYIGWISLHLNLLGQK